MQLRCSQKTYPTAQPFLQSPFHGWTDINSFFDHDYPDYAQDGTIILANGMTATSADGQESDVFPAYWSPALRQYINYDGHNGYDFGISYQPVYAAAAGTVEYAGWNGPTETSGYGQMILIDHHNGYTTLYGHLSRLDVSSGDKVQAGQEIGISGTTGNSTGPHLHFSVFHNCQVTDPYGWTGQNQDPLHSFNGQDSSYLWLPDQDPLVLNPPPDWPTFPLGVKIPAAVRRAARLHIPAADRLLLLKLPVPQSLHAVSAGAAMADTEALVTRESERVIPALKALRRRHLVSNYELIPAAAAVWVRGLAFAQQLEDLPGVASLSGVEPKDLLAAQTDVAHDVLMQVMAQSAPTLWPVGYRSALHAWRPVATVMNGEALITGFALPGAKVGVVLRRHGVAVGSTAVEADAQNGGFVATVHDLRGNPIETHAHDVLQVVTNGRKADLQIAPFSLKARSTSVSGRSRPGATVAATVLGASRAWSGVTVADRAGNYHFALPFRLAAGSLAVASVADAAGDEESASGFVPGLDLETGAGQINGWAVSSHPKVALRRGARTLYATTVSTASDGSFSLHLPHGLRLAPGDSIAVSTRTHHRIVSIPATRLAVLGNPSDRVALAAIPNSAVNVTSQFGSQTVRLNKSGQGSFPAHDLLPGARVEARIVLPRGDTINWWNWVPSLTIKLDSGLIDGRTTPNTTVVVTSGKATSRSNARGGKVHVFVPGGIKTGSSLVIHVGRSQEKVPLSPIRVAWNNSRLAVDGNVNGGVLVLRDNNGLVTERAFSDAKELPVSAAQVLQTAQAYLLVRLPGSLPVFQQISLPAPHFVSHVTPR